MGIGSLKVHLKAADAHMDDADKGYTGGPKERERVC